MGSGGWHERNSEEKKINFSSPQILVSSLRSWLTPSSVHGWTQYTIGIFQKKKKKIYPEGKNLSIYFPPCDNQKSFFALYFDFVFAREQNGSWQKMVHVNKFLIVLDYIEAACCEISL